MYWKDKECEAIVFHLSATNSPYYKVIFALLP